MKQLSSENDSFSKSQQQTDPDLDKLVNDMKDSEPLYDKEKGQNIAISDKVFF